MVAWSGWETVDADSEASSKTAGPRFTMPDSVRDLAHESLQRDRGVRFGANPTEHLG